MQLRRCFYRRSSRKKNYSCTWQCCRALIAESKDSPLGRRCRASRMLPGPAQQKGEAPMPTSELRLPLATRLWSAAGRRQPSPAAASGGTGSPAAVRIWPCMWKVAQILPNTGTTVAIASCGTGIPDLQFMKSSW